MRRYLVIVERQKSKNFSVYSPDLPGCVATGKTRPEALRNMRDAIGLHIEGMVEDGERVPKPFATADYVEVA